MQTTIEEPINGKQLVENLWNEQKEKHPNFFAGLHIVKGVLEFFFGGHFVPWLLLKVLMFSSRVADGVLMAAALWVTAIRIQPEYTAHFVGGAANASNFSSLSLLAFSLLPELITVAALVTTIKHVIAWSKRREFKNVAWIWTFLYGIPTLTFLSMTVWTIASFVNADGGTAQITGGLLVVRCLAALGYSIIEILYFFLGKNAMIEADEKAKLRISLNETAEKLRKLNAELYAEQTQSAEKIANLTAELNKQDEFFRTKYSAVGAELSAELLRNEDAEKESSAPTNKKVPQQDEENSAKVPQRLMRKKTAEKEVRNSVNADEVSARRADREKRNAKILELKKENSALSNREIATQVGCNEKVVRLLLNKTTAEYPQESEENSAVNE